MPPGAKSSLAFESPAAEQNVPDSRYVAVHTGVNHKAFCNQNFKLTCMGVHSNYNELLPVRNDVHHAVCATSVRTEICIQSVGSNQSFIPPGSLNRVPTIFWRSGEIVTSAERHLTLHDP